MSWVSNSYDFPSFSTREEEERREIERKRRQVINDFPAFLIREDEKLRRWRKLLDTIERRITVGGGVGYIHRDEWDQMKGHLEK